MKESETNPAAGKEQANLKEIVYHSTAAIEAIVGHQPKMEITSQNFKEQIEVSLMSAVAGLPEHLAKKLGTVDAELLNDDAEKILIKMKEEKDPANLADLQIELIFRYIAITSRVQNGGDKGFLPSVAKEVDGMDCSLSVWSLKQKLEQAKAPNLEFKFGYPVEHAVAVIRIADGRIIYVDAQNGFIEEVKLKEVHDLVALNTVYKIFEITDAKTLIGHLPNEGEVSMTRPEGSNYVPKYLGIQQDGLLHTLGNMHMLLNPESPIYNLETATKFRARTGMSETESKEWKKHYTPFEAFVQKAVGGKEIYDTKFATQESA